MDDGVDARLGQDPGNGRMPDIGFEEFGSAQMVLRWHGVDPDHPVDVRIALDTADEPAAQLPCDSRDEHDLAQDQPFLPAATTTGQAVQATLSGRCCAVMTAGCPWPHFRPTTVHTAHNAPQPPIAPRR